jgi:DNA-binding NtrC family response regulator
MGGTAAGLLWVGEDGSERELVETAAREFALEARFCRPAEVLEVIRGTRVDVIGLDLPAESRAGLALLRELHERLPRVAILAASADPSVSLIRAAPDGGASDVLSLPLAGRARQGLRQVPANRGPERRRPRRRRSVLSIYGAEASARRPRREPGHASHERRGTDTAIVDLTSSAATWRRSST